MLIFTIEIIKIKGGKTPASRCDVKSLEGCNERETKYIEAKKSLTKDALVTELARLNELGGKKMPLEPQTPTLTLTLPLTLAPTLTLPLTLTRQEDGAGAGAVARRPRGPPGQAQAGAVKK